MKQLDWRAFILGLTFLSTTAFAVEIFYGQTGTQDWYFNNQVLIDGGNLPADMNANTGQTTITLEGEGTLTVGHQTKGAEKLNVMVTGGTTITSERRWETADTKVWWEGIFPTPREGETPLADNISFVTEGKHPDSWVVPLATYSMGLSNETFLFSQPAYFTFATEIPDGTKLWMAFKAKVTPAGNDGAKWTVTEGDFCVAEDNICRVALKELGDVSFVQEYFRTCPRSGSSNTSVENGNISSTPQCFVTCNRGYELDYSTMKCVAPEGNEEGELLETIETSSESQRPVVSQEETRRFPPGYIRFTGTRSQLENEVSTDGLSGAELARVLKHNASVRKTVADDMPAEIVDTTAITENDSFLNYILQIRNFFGAGSNSNVVRSEEGENTEEEATIEGEEVHTSAPLLPSTGPGIFLGLAALGLGCMMVGRGRK